jgi:YHS domain-containing protein
MKRIIATCVLFVVCALTAHAYEKAAGCGNCASCSLRKKVFGSLFSSGEIKREELTMEMKPLENGYVTFMIVLDETKAAKLQKAGEDYKKGKEKIKKDKNSKLCECCGCKEKMEWNEAGKLDVQTINFKFGILQIITSNTPEVVKKLLNPFTKKKTEMSQEKVKDLVCGMHIDKERAIKTEYEGKTYYFCAQHCKDKFSKEPGKYIEKQ